MNTIKLFCDGSVNPQKKIGFASYFIYTQNDTIELAKDNIKTKKFENTSSTKLELEGLLWALDDKKLIGENITIYTDCQNILGLGQRREKLESNNYKTTTGKILKNHTLYKQFYEKMDTLNCTFVKVKGHKPSQDKDNIDKLFTLADKASRNSLREYLIPAFTLFEVLVSLVILSVMMISLTKLYKNDDTIQTYYELQNIENNYIETKSINNSENIKFNSN